MDILLLVIIGYSRLKYHRLLMVFYCKLLLVILLYVIVGYFKSYYDY